MYFFKFSLWTLCEYYIYLLMGTNHICFHVAGLQDKFVLTVIVIATENLYLNQIERAYSSNLKFSHIPKFFVC